MKIEYSILNRLSKKVESIDDEKITPYSIINEIKDIYMSFVKNGYIDEDEYIKLAAYILYAGFVMEK